TDREVGLDRDGPLQKERHRRAALQLVGRRQAFGVGQGQRRQTVFVLGAQVQRGPAGRQNLQARAFGQQLGDQPYGPEQVFEVIEDEQHLAVAQVVFQAVEQRLAAGFLDV